MSTATLETMRALTLKLHDEIFAIEAGSVREILDMVPITHVPDAPAFASGLINVRGRVVPLADLRVVFSMPRRPADAESRIVVIEIEVDGEPTVASILADRVTDVTEIDAGSIEKPPRVGMRLPPELIRGIAKRNGDFIIIPDLRRIFASQGGTKTAPAEEKTAQ